MPKKIRELKQMLQQAGFISRTGKGSHSNWFHPLYAGRITISGKDGSDAREYLEKEVLKAIQEVKKRGKNGQT
ncbi:type II toxin-antitoxin system HicA family toxin [Crocosphaera sp. XPORK-15E]|uniref:type II toxin-antitoxin system HicA family toxin n=1 Tax=Crocosphaera sp. XPORK-15E TaxID=3110247 RepID=UPI002B20B9B5|nr:type II toxin-antitoxin system HicA family toxin [Crocosphaera sp. XPORK-15E]MEA5534323.1 type II toxin-antitoxin system HicA family toxin [Crocosphaera sp. XPORK-15E]